MLIGSESITPPWAMLNLHHTFSLFGDVWMAVAVVGSGLATERADGVRTMERRRGGGCPVTGNGLEV
jgi:hypothetical protein